MDPRRCEAFSEMVDQCGLVEGHPGKHIFEDATPLRPDAAPPQTHELKTWPIYFARVLSGEKTFELRKNDRDFGEGDTLRLREWGRNTETYTGREVVRYVSHIYTGDHLEFGYVIMSIASPPSDTAPVAWLWSRLQRPRYDFPVDWQMTRYRENVPPATHVRPLVDVHPEDAPESSVPPGGPYFCMVQPDVDGWLVENDLTGAIEFTGTKQQCIAVRDALNRVDRLPGDETC